jgi:DNA-binding CsgD family transcriptional regulator
VLDAAVHLSHCADPAQFAVEGAQQLLGLLGAEVAAFTYLDLGSRRAQVLITPDVPQYSGPAAHASTTLHDNPLPAYWASSEAPAPSRVSDHLSARAWRGTATYSEVLRPMGTPHMLGVPLLDAARGGPSCAVSRSGRDFSARDVDVATALQAALLAVYTRVSAPVGAPSQPPRQVLGRGLTAREAQVLTLLSEGSTAWAIARRLQVSPATVRKHLEHLYRKLEVQDRLSAVNRGRELGLLPAPSSPCATEQVRGTSLRSAGGRASDRR